jgi:ankyrin repeat protein
MDSLAKKHNRRDVRKALENLPKELDDTYSEAMQRIQSQDEEDAKLAKQVLFWISYAFRPLTISQVRHALAVEPGNITFDEDALPDEDVLVSVCAGLVAVDQKSNIIRLVHYTTQQYFGRFRTALFPDAQTSIATTCLTYVSFDAFAEGYCRSDQEMETRMHKYPLLEYAAQHWGVHAREGPEEAIQERVLKFLENNSKLMCSIQVMRLPGYRYPGYSQEFPKHVTGLHLVAYIGLTKIIWLLLEREGVDINSKDSDGRTALSWAAESGHEAVVRLLLEHKADVDAKANYGRTALHRAAGSGHEAVVRLLLEHKVDVDAKDKDGWTALFWAAGGGHEAVVRLLLEHKADVNAKDKDGKMVLFRAAGSGHEAVVRLLLEHKADVDTKIIYGGTVLHWAAGNGHEAIVRLLLEHKADVDAKDEDGGTALYWAARDGHETVVQLLLEHKADVDAKDEDGGTALYRAAGNGHEAVVRLLLDHKADVNTEDEDGETALHRAAGSGHEAVVRLLEARKASR